MEIKVFSKNSPLSESEFEQFYALMEVSFPECERKTKEEFLKLCKVNKLYKVYGAFEGDTLVGFFTVWEFNSFTFGDHFTVLPSFRNRGIGSLILKHIKESSTIPLVIEVEYPNEIMSEKRLKFYLRNDFKQNSFDYLLPPMQKGFEPMPMIILSYPRLILEADFAEIRDIIYKEVYNGFAL